MALKLGEGVSGVSDDSQKKIGRLAGLKDRIMDAINPETD